MPTTPAQRRVVGGAPERHRTLAEVCELYFPGVTPCALRWMIKRRGYAHSRWGREYRLTDSQVAAIQEDMAQPPRQARAPAASPGNAGARKQAGATPRTPQASSPPPRRRMAAPPGTDVRQALATQLASPLAVTLTSEPPASDCPEA